MNPKHFETVNRKQLEFMMRVAVRANTTFGVISSPGFGKTTIAQIVAAKMGRTVLSLILPGMDGADIGGVGVLKNGEFVREPLKLLKLATEEACIVIWEEATCATQDVQAAMLDPIFSRRIADGIPFHPDTRHFVLFNPENEAPNASPLALSLSQRFGVVHFVPSIDEVVEYFAGNNEYENIMGGEKSKDPAREWFARFAAYCAHNASELIQLVPDDAAINEGARTGLPRNWEYALRNAAACEIEMDADKIEKGPERHFLLRVALAQFVGATRATTLLGRIALEEKFPSVEQIVKNPAGCDLPGGEDQIGVLGLLQSVARKDAWAAWIYAGRCRPEIQAAATVGLGSRTKVPPRSPHAKAGREARNLLCGKVGNRMGRRAE